MPPTAELPDGGATTKEDDMAEGQDVPEKLHQTTLSRLDGVAVLHHEHVNIFSKILDLNYEMDRKIVSLAQSLGVREVTSQSGQTGIPLAGGVAGK